jgi:hypothetical protein
LAFIHAVDDLYRSGRFAHGSKASIADGWLDDEFHRGEVIR